MILNAPVDKLKRRCRRALVTLFYRGSKARSAYPSSTHVSFVPPPWLEFTTSEPSLSATRVKPPGTMQEPRAPESTKGRRSTCRGATPAATNVGQVDRASVG